MKIFLINHNQILNEIAQKFEITQKIEEADRVVLWNDVTSFERGIVNYAHTFKKPVIVIQHGRKGTSRYFPPFNEPITADKLCVWGIRDKEALIKAGHPEKKIIITGTTIFSYLKPRKKHKGINIVFCPEHWDYEVEENRWVANELRKLKKYKVITKLIEGHEEKFYQNPIKSDRDSDKHLPICADILAIADLVVGISESTFELMAQYLDIPVVIMEEWKPKPFGGDKRYLTYRRIISEASKRTTLKNLIPTIEQQLKNPEELKKERKEVCILEGGTDIKNPLEEIIKVIKNV